MEQSSSPTRFLARHIIGWQNARKARKMIIPKGTRFNCLPDCAKCCGDTPEHVRHILLTKAEAEKIRHHTDVPTMDFCSPTSSSAKFDYEMKKINGKCVWLNGYECSIYKNRPLICRYYPFSLRINGGTPEFGSTPECPGLGEGERLTRNYFRKLLNLAIEKLGPIEQN